MAHAPPAARRVIGNWEIIEVLGSGSFAIVWKARHTTTGTLAAVKEVLTDRLNKKLLESLESEIATLQRLKHANIVGLLDLFKEPGKIFLVLEYCGGGDLAQYLRHRGPLSEASCRYLLRHLAEGLKVLRAHNIIHRDLKPQNLLLSDSGPSPTLKIADFGFARSLQPAGMAETLCGSPLYMAPEVLQLARYDAKADLWSVGTILFELLAGRPPFQGANHLQLVQNIERGDAVLPDAVARALTPGCRQLLHQLLRRNPVERISHDELFAHPFLQGEAASAAVALPAPIAAAVAALAAQEPSAPPGPLQPPSAQQRHVPVSQGAVRFITPAARDRSPVHPLLRPTPGTSPNTSGTSPPVPPGTAAINVAKSQESAAPIHQHLQQQKPGVAGTAAAAPQTAGGVGVGVGGVAAPVPGRVAAPARVAPAIAVREVIHRSPSPHVAATTAAVESVFMEGAEAAAHATRVGAAGGRGGGGAPADALAESSDSDYVVVCSPSSTPRHPQKQPPPPQQQQQLLSPRTQHPAISNSAGNSRSNSGGGAPPSPTVPHPAAAQQPAPQWQQALPPIAAATLPHSAQPVHTLAGATTLTIRVPGPQPAGGAGGGGAIAGAGAGGAGGGDGDTQLLPRVISLLLDHAKARCTSLLDKEAEARQFGLGGGGTAAASGLGGGWGGAGLAGTEEGAGMAEEAAEAVGTLLVAVRLLAAALSSRSAAAAAAAPAAASTGAATPEAEAEAASAETSDAAALNAVAAGGDDAATQPQPAAAGAAPAQSPSPFAAAASATTPGPAPDAVADSAAVTTGADAAATVTVAAADGARGRLATATSLRSLAVQARDALALMDEHMHGTVAQLLLGGADVASAASASVGPSAAPPGPATAATATAAVAPTAAQPLVPCALDALMATAVRHSRAAAGEELLGHAAGAAEHYGAAADVLAFLLAAPLPPGGGAGDSQLRHPAAVPAEVHQQQEEEGDEAGLSKSELLLQSVRPPLAPHDRQRLTKYYAAVKLRQSAAAAAAAAGATATGTAHNHHYTNNYYTTGGPKGAPHHAYGNRHQGPYGAVVY